MQNAVASRGYPAPRVFVTCTDASVLGGSFRIMDRMPGHVMINLPESEAIPVSMMPEMLAKAHLDLHRIDVASVRQALEGAGISRDRYSIEGRWDRIVRQIDAGGFHWLLPGVYWIHVNQPAVPARLVVCHGDFQPINILIHEGKVSGVLDWSGFLISDPAYDLGITKILGTIAAPFLLPMVNWTHLIN